MAAWLNVAWAHANGNESLGVAVLDSLVKIHHVNFVIAVAVTLKCQL